ncbi:protein of unknown function [Azospirillum baldaniorum]|uniref:Uncharacterized protein n=1 Tax=Azospirillum baldaniorum TaxID=1064539 RepID=A0A9P1NMT3_9PROT|nr:protein of unknown function [Azospirillum baldaniorum]
MTRLRGFAKGLLPNPGRAKEAGAGAGSSHAEGSAM